MKKRYWSVPWRQMMREEIGKPRPEGLERNVAVVRCKSAIRARQKVERRAAKMGISVWTWDPWEDMS